MTQMIQRKQTRTHLSKSRLGLSALLLALTLWCQPKIAQAQWADNGSNLTTSDNVGIGTTTPINKLQVDGNIDTTDGVDRKLILRSSTNYNYALQTTGDDFQIIEAPGSNGSVRLHIDYPNGNIGIGTTSPTAKLHVAGGSGSDVAIDALGRLIINNGAGGNNFIVASTNTANPRMDFYTASIHRMTVDYGGNVGIGTSTPSGKLEVAGNQVFGGRGIAGANSVLTHVSSGEVASEAILRFGYWYSAGSYNAGIWDIKRKADNSLGFAYVGSGIEDSTKSMYISTAGNVGIGTINPSTKLEVAGDITATGNIAAKYQDVAEWVTSPKKMPAGTVVILHPDQTNQVLPSIRSYDTRVAGVISEMPGILLGEAGEGKVKVATTGRVKVKVDATKKPVQVGDLLVTSDKEGVAMKSEAMEINGRPFHQPGTILGKALEPLKEGEGEILVLLSMQ